MTRLIFSHVLPGLCLTLMIAACARTPVPRLYVLAAGTAITVPPTTEAPVVSPVGLEPIILPEYLDRPQIVTRVAENRLEASDTHRWAEPLEGSVARVLRENLSVLLAPAPVLAYPWSRSEKPGLRLGIEVLRFEAGPDSLFRLSARWTMRDGYGKRIGQVRYGEYSAPAGPADHGSQARSASEVLALLAQDIVKDLFSPAAGR